MRIAFFINDIATEKPQYATLCLARAAIARGHEVWFVNVDGFAYDPDDYVRAHGRGPSRNAYDSNEALLEDLQGEDCRQERLTVDDLDVLMLRNNPADDLAERPWAGQVGLIFGQAAKRHGVIVLNDPDGLAQATSKLYFQAFPEEVRPRTLITRNEDSIRAFREEVGTIVLKPMQGSGGQSVFLCRPEDAPNFNQILDAVSQHGYIIAQEYLPRAAEGDVRLFLMNGRPLCIDGRHAAIYRAAAGEDMRSNTHAGGDVLRAEITEEALRVAELVRPKLVEDGMFLVGLDIAGDKIMEVNVFSPGGLWNAERFEERDFSGAVVDAIAAKVDARRRFQHSIDNRILATM